MFVRRASAEASGEAPGSVPSRVSRRVSDGRSVTRRGAMRGLVASAVALALAPVVAASRPSRALRPGDRSFDEMYRGRHILGTRIGSDGRAAYGTGGAWVVTVDGRPLHLMRRADGSYMSMVDHYESYPTPLDAARAAVDGLGPSEHLRDMDMGLGRPGAGGRDLGSDTLGRTATGATGATGTTGDSGATGNGVRGSGAEGSSHHHGVHA
ncbi:tyrosinase family oxidase copper chaperone [Streptomyces sp. Tue6028]|uniref:tyrosinase family oxidase copper chaperone n=1 Tax=Streptomyces sp. Tue6028 TaxID=2036037 RepID=UPI003D72BDFC